MKYIQFLNKKVIERKTGIPYLVRWNLFGIGEDSKYFSVKLHKILISDDECLHDHPWWFISIILKGSYTEWRFCTEEEYYNETQFHKWDAKAERFTKGYNYTAGTILIRPAWWPHRLEVIKPVYTLVFTFKKIRKWGFFTRNGWKHWRLYNNDTDC